MHSHKGRGWIHSTLFSTQSRRRCEPTLFITGEWVGPWEWAPELIRVQAE